MPDKRTPCDKNCLRCWRNKLKHGNKLKTNCYKIETYGMIYNKMSMMYEYDKEIEIDKDKDKDKEPITNQMVRRMNRIEKNKEILNSI